jgi:GAF domain-containing protein
MFAASVPALAYRAFAGRRWTNVHVHRVVAGHSAGAQGHHLRYVALAFDEPGTTEEQVRLARGISDFIAVAVENARLFSKTGAQPRAEGNCSTSASASQTLDLQPLLGSILHAARHPVQRLGDHPAGARTKS